MQKFVIPGEQYNRQGELKVYGAKNSAIKLIPAALLCNSKVILHNIPPISDIATTAEIVTKLGGSVQSSKPHTYEIDPTSVNNANIPFDIATKIRTSFLFVVPLLTRFGTVTFPHPGGDSIGSRPIDMTLESLRLMGANVIDERDIYTFSLPNKRLHGIDYTFKWISHTGTENLIMAAVLAQGTTRIFNAAQEPEVVALCDFFRQCGANISGDGTSCIIIEGVDSLSGTEFTNISDRLEAGTFAILGAMTKSNLTISNIEPTHLDVFWKFLSLAGVTFELGNDFVKILSADNLQALNIKTHEYPGFATDLQAPFTVMLTQARGTSIVQETIFDGRLFYTDILNKMGANIIMCDPYRVVVNGPTQLYGQNIESPDIRAGMALLLAALVAKGQTEIYNIHHIDRGYAQIEDRLAEVGFNVQRL